MAQEKVTIIVLNQSDRTIQTSLGNLDPKKSLELPEKEAKSLLAYKGIVDAAKIVPEGVRKQSEKALLAENAKLKAKVAELEKKPPKSEGGKDDAPKSKAEGK